MDLVTTAFLNVLIGSLYNDYSSDQLNGLLSFEGLTPAIKVRIKMVVENAKSFYSDREKFNSDVNDAIYGSKN